MKIKKLEIVGFKSFVDRTVVHFDHDVLGIVGPNGCGKSNIVDAIRWCMGEQSARHLRGRSMEDVIFSGSDSRAPHDFAEVTLTFENDTPEDVPLEYKEYAEIAVTRRLHRSGESEYIINKTQVRLRDVTDLFLGTGAGTKAYSIVEQGKIGLIVSAKPEDRRLLIEEAAGITKFKSRKKQAEKKMELTQQNLLRVGDIVAEIDRNLASLKRQAAKAERYVSYRGELEDLQLHEAAHRYLELAGWIKLEGGEVERLTEGSEGARGELAIAEAELEGARLEAHAVEETLEAAQNASFAADSTVKAGEAAIERAKDRLGALRRREEQAAGEQAEMAAQLGHLLAEHEVVRAEVVAFEADEAGQAQRNAEEEAKLGDHAAAHATSEADVTGRRQAIAKAQAVSASAEAKLAGFDRRQVEIAARCEKVAAERGEVERSREETAARVAEHARAIEDLRTGKRVTAEEKVRLEGSLSELKERIVGQEKAYEETKGELSRRRSRHGALVEMHARLEGVGAGTKALVRSKDACVLGLVADRIEAPAELTQALAGLLGSSLEDVVVDDVERGIALLEDLAQGKKGRATIRGQLTPYVAGARQDAPEDAAIVARLVDTLRFAPADEPLVQTLVGDALVVRDLTAARRLRTGGVRAALVTLDGAVLHADGRIAGGQGDKLAAGFLDGKREARELAEEIQRLDAVASHRLEALQASRVELARVGAALDVARQQAHAGELALVTAEKDLQKAEERLASVSRRAEQLTSEGAELAGAIEEATFERAEAARVLEEARSVVEVTGAALGEAEAVLADAREKLEAQRQVVTACKVATAGVREKLSAARGTASRLARSAEELRQRERRLDEELADNARAFGETAAALMKHREDLQRALDEARVAHDDLARTRAAFEELRTALLEREGGLKDLRARVDGIRAELAAHEMALRERQLSMEHLLGGVAEKFRGLQLGRVVGDYHMRPPPDEVTHDRIDELGKLIERMGSVNLDAMREHAEAEERFTYYSSQKEDLEKALADLTRAIQQMNRESRRLFDATFAAINAKFQEIFPRMFRGGRAELRLTNPEDLLETGIDIVAQPPGKKLSSIELMSGGEKALTAVSLIFAIFQIKPSPFCILDEVDAPLDEANVARYNDIIRSMTDRSQFILITHIKRTMQMVDVLYGVTMPEAGVSKIVSVKMNEAARRAEPRPVERAERAERVEQAAAVA
jgi:chromosome segregation protein